MIADDAPEVGVAGEGAVLDELRAAGGHADIVNETLASVEQANDQLIPEGEGDGRRIGRLTSLEFLRRYLH